MATVFHSQGVGKPILVEDLLAKHGPYEVGRWCVATAGKVPDRCDLCPLADVQPAIGFVQSEGWRYGFCASHQAKTERVHKRKGQLLEGGGS